MILLLSLKDAIRVLFFHVACSNLTWIVTKSHLIVDDPFQNR